MATNNQEKIQINKTQINILIFLKCFAKHRVLSNNIQLDTKTKFNLGINKTSQ